MSYCNRCGKEIDYESPICIECVAMLKVEAEESKTSAPEPGVELNNNHEGEPSADSESFYEVEESDPDAESFSEGGESDVEGGQTADFFQYEDNSRSSYTPPVENIFAGDYSRGFNRGKKPNMIGFGRALFAAIIGLVGDMFVSISTLLPYFGILAPNVHVYNIDAIISVLNWLFAFPAAVLGIVFGALSIATFRRYRFDRPIATLVLGIVALALGSSTVMAVLSMI